VCYPEGWAGHARDDKEVCMFWVIIGSIAGVVVAEEAIRMGIKSRKKKSPETTRKRVKSMPINLKKDIFGDKDGGEGGNE
jgi:hypothetical protein